MKKILLCSLVSLFVLHISADISFNLPGIKVELPSIDQPTSELPLKKMRISKQLRKIKDQATSYTTNSVLDNYLNKRDALKAAYDVRCHWCVWESANNALFNETWAHLSNDRSFTAPLSYKTLYKLADVLKRDKSPCVFHTGLGYLSFVALICWAGSR